MQVWRNGDATGLGPVFRKDTVGSNPITCTQVTTIGVSMYNVVWTVVGILVIVFLVSLLV